MARTIAVVTGSRAEWGLLRTVAAAVAARRELALRVVVAGAHLVSGTWRDVQRDGYDVAAKVPLQRKGAAGRWADAAAVGRGVAGFAKVFEAMRPDVVLVLGDRVEVLAAATAAAVGGLRVAHLHGGDRAEGVADESMRHAVSKLAHLHFPATALSRRRLIRMGEDPRRIWAVGSPAADGLQDVQPWADPAPPTVLVMQHPIGGSDEEERAWMAGTLAGVTDVAGAVLFAPNGDPGAAGVWAALREVDPGLGHITQHLPRDRFLPLLAGSAAIVGNSSAGLIEAGVLRVPCVNVGPRQGGREHGTNVVHCGYGRSSVAAALRRALRMDRRRIRHPFGPGDTGRRVAEVLVTVDLSAVPVRKRNAY